MSFRYRSNHGWRLLLVTLIAASVAAIGIHPGTGAINPDDERLRRMNQAVEQIWERSDGPVARGKVDQAWLWGPAPITISTETYPESPSGERTLIYYDKGRLDILDPHASTSSEWYAVGGLLVYEMLAGRIQLGDTFFVERAIPNIPLTGDVDQAQAVTYATLAPYTSAWTGADDGVVFASGGERRTRDRTGEVVAAALDSDGRLLPNGKSDSTVVYAGYDAMTGHNIAGVFASWNAAQPYPALYLLGYPISEPYWIETVIEGQPETVLVQAFQRRVLTYRPGNPEGKQVESANAGDHYRTWRGLTTITDDAVVRLAAGVPFGEELVKSALAWDVDPYMLAAMSQVLSGGNPQAVGLNGGRGLLAVHPELHDVPDATALRDPALNADNGARALAFWLPDGDVAFDWRAVLANYYTHGQVDWNDAALHAFVSEALATYETLQAELAPRQAGVDAGHWGGVLDRGPAAYYDPSYTTSWWERTQLLYASKGVIAPEYAPDPNGYYCVRPGYVPGERLRLRANGITITCTVGDMVADHDLHNWLLVSNWAVELSWSAFTALGLQQSNYVEVDYPGPWAKQPPPIPPPTPEATETPTATPEPTATMIGSPPPTPTTEPVEGGTPAPTTLPEPETRATEEATPGPEEPSVPEPTSESAPPVDGDSTATPVN